MNIYEVELKSPHIVRIFVRDLSPLSNGNAIGIGLADFTTRRFVNKIDIDKTDLSSTTAVTPEKARIPMVFQSEKKALNAAFQTLASTDAESVRLLWIQNTSSLVDVMASPGACSSIEPDMFEKVEGPLDMRWDEGGNLVLP